MLLIPFKAYPRVLDFFTNKNNFNLNKYFNTDYLGVSTKAIGVGLNTNKNQ